MMRAFALCVSLLSAGTAHAQTPNVYAAWSQVIGETVPMASAPASVEMRFVIEGTDAKPSEANEACAKFLIAPPGTAPADVVNNGRTAVARPQSFNDIFVCRLDIPGVQAQLFDTAGQPVKLVSMMNLHNHSLDAANWVAGPSNGEPIVVAGADWIGRNAAFQLLTLGDTGCRGGGRQNCSDWQGSDDWPLRQIAGVGAQLAPDLVIHVGDFRYFRENTPGYTTDTWQLWQKDFFPLAQPLLLAAPWATARGNHEGCGNATLAFGIGYFQFFGQSDAIDCNDLGPPVSGGGQPIYRTPWYFDVIPNTGGPGDVHRFVMIDANDYESQAGVNAVQAEAHFKTAIDITAAGQVSSWWVWHSPAVQRITWKQQPFGDPTLRRALLSAAGLNKSDGARFCLSGNVPNCNPSMFLLGHQHLYQDVTFDKNGKWIFPRSTIVGHGGVNLRDSNPGRGHVEFCQESDFPLGRDGKGDVTGVVNTVVDHGFVLWTRLAGDADHGQSGWSPQYSWVSDYTVDASGKVVGTLGGLPDVQPESAPTCLSAN